LLHEGGGVAAGVLDSFGITLEQVRNETIKILSQNTNKQPRPATKSLSKTQTLDQFSIDLTALARAGKLDPVEGREKEMQRVIQILSRRNKNNPLLSENQVSVKRLLWKDSLKKL